MKLSFRWYGKDDPVSLEYISQIPQMHSVVSAVYTVSVGQVWPQADIDAISSAARAHGLVFDVVESVPVHEDIKLAKPSRDKYIDVYIENLKRLGRAGVRCVCYNFMPVFDWTRTTLDMKAADGSTSLVYHIDDLKRLDPLGGISLPGWDSSYAPDDMKRLMREYAELGEEGLWENLEYFLKAVVPEAEKAGICMAIHPDDPPWNIFGLPRIIRDEAALDRLLGIVDSPSNSLTLCTGSLGCSPKNDVVRLMEKYVSIGRVKFVHFRNVRILPDGGFEETAHPSACGSLDMAGIMQVLARHDYDGYIRPDHGRMIWSEQGRPGYGLYDRALGAAYINGLWEAFRL